MKPNLMKYLASPGKLASALDWKKASGTVLAIDVGSDKIGVCIAVHPSHGDEPLRLDPIPLKLITKSGNKRVLAKPVLEELQTIVKNYNVCGVLAAFPLQPEGRAGAPCGKVLHTLDSLIEESSNIINTKRPFALWDEHHFSPEDDEFGRHTRYGEPCPVEKSLEQYKASEHQYAHKCSSTVAAAVWNDFCMKQWPRLYQDREDDQDIMKVAGRTTTASASSSDSYFKDDWLDSPDDNETYTDAALL